MSIPKARSAEGHSAKRKGTLAVGAIWPREARPATRAVEGHLRDLGPRGFFCLSHALTRFGTGAALGFAPKNAPLERFYPRVARVGAKGP